MLADLTNPQAVLAAMKECDSLGREAFLAKHGFGEARSYFLEYGGRRYDSKAIAGVAHGHQHGRPLTSTEFSGGDKTVAAKLTELGFYVTRPAADWVTPIGSILTKTEIKALYGGTIYGGIEPSRSTPNIMIFTDPSVGHEHGYKFDEWDAVEPGVFYYSGEGQEGDQELVQGNRAVLDHAQSGRVIRLFEAVDGKQRPGGKLQRYVGAFYLDQDAPYSSKVAPDKYGTPRRVLVFRLIRDELVGFPERPVAAPAVPAKASSVPKTTPTPVAICSTCYMALPASGVCDECG